MRSLKLPNLYFPVVLLAFGLVATGCDIVTADIPPSGPRNLSLAEPEEVGMSSERLERVSQAMQSLVDDGRNLDERSSFRVHAKYELGLDTLWAHLVDGYRDEHVTHSGKKEK